MRATPALVLVAASWIAPSAVARGDWPCWRGPARDGVSSEGDLAEMLPAGELWSRAVGAGHSCPSVAEGALYTLGFDREAQRDRLWCLDAVTGELRWSAEWPAELMNLGHGGGTLSTPAVHEGRVYVSSRAGELRCFDAATGASVWERPLARELELEATEYGFGGSPLVHDGRVVVNMNATLALEAEGGELHWRTRPHLAMYSTPQLFEHAGAPCLALFTKEHVALARLEDGAELASHPFRKGPTTVNASTPVVVGERLFVSSGYRHGCALLEFGAEGARPVFESSVMRNKLSGCALFEGQLYGFDESMLKCIDLTGRERWRKRGLGVGALLIADGRLFVMSERGELVLARASPDGYEELDRRGTFPGGPCWTSPVLADGLLYLRDGEGRLVCLNLRQAQPPSSRPSGGGPPR